MRVNDLVLGLASLGLGSAVIVLAAGFPSPPQQAYGPALFPTLIGAGMAACGLVFLFHWATTSRGSTAVSLPDWWRSHSARLNVAALVAAPVFYLLAVERLGFVLTAFVCLAALLALFHRRIAFALVTAAVVAPLAFAVFTEILLVPLPLGSLVEPLIR